MPLCELFDLFMIEQISTKKKATIKLYKWVLKPFIKIHGGKKAKNLKKSHLQLYVIEIREEGRLSDTSLNAIVQVLKYFTNWLFHEEYIDRPLSGAIKQRVPRETTKDKPTNAAMFKLMLEHARSIRDKLIIILTADTAGRRGEVASIRIQHIDLEALKIQVSGKEGQRVVTIVKSTAEMIDKYIRYYRPKVDHDYLFCSKNKPHNPLQEGGIYGAFKAAAKAIPEELRTGPYHPHSFRRWAAEVYNEKGDVYLAKQKLGHKKLSTTMTYLNESLAKVQSRDEKFSLVNELSP